MDRQQVITLLQICDLVYRLTEKKSLMAWSVWNAYYVTNDMIANWQHCMKAFADAEGGQFEYSL